MVDFFSFFLLKWNGTFGTPISHQTVIPLFHLDMKHVEMIWLHSVHLLIIRFIICTSLGETTRAGAFPEGLSKCSKGLLWRLLKQLSCKDFFQTVLQWNCSVCLCQTVSAALWFQSALRKLSNQHLCLLFTSILLLLLWLCFISRCSLGHGCSLASSSAEHD